MTKGLKYIFMICVIFLSFISFSFCVSQNLDPLTLPPLDNRVVDYSNTLDQETLSQLNSKAQQIQQSTQTQIAVALIRHRNGNELIDIGLKLFRESKLGSAEKNNGLLLLIATEEKKLRILVGYGLEGDLPDVLISQIIEENIRPLVNKDDVAGAINAYLDAVPKYIGPDAQGLPAQSTQQARMIFLFFGFFLGFFLGEMIEAIFLSNKKRRESESSSSRLHNRKFISQLLPYILPFGAVVFLLFATGIGYQIRLGLGTLLGGIFAYFTDINHPRRDSRGYHGGRSSGGGFGGGGFGGGGFSGLGGSSGGGGAGD